MAQTSIHVCPVKAGSEKHNSREKSLDYVDRSLSKLNESFRYSACSIDQRLSEIAKDYAAAHGKKLHAKATPIREAVVVLDEHSSIEDIKKACAQCQAEFGIRAMQIYIHRDEGHKDKTTGKWKSNLHAHIVFDWYNEQTHTTCKLSREDTARMQTIFAGCLGMQRGKSSDKSHLTALQYKTEAEIRNLQKDLSKAKEMGLIEAFKVNALNKIEDSEDFIRIKTENQELQKENTAIRTQALAVQEKLQEKIRNVRKEAAYQVEQAQKAEKEARQEVKGWERTMQPFKWLLLAWNQLQALAENKYGNIFHPHIQNAITKLRDMFRIPSTERAAGHLVDTCPYLSEKQKDEVWPEVKKDVEIIERWEMRQGLHR